MLMKNWNRPGAAFSELPRHVAIRSLAELRECMMLVRPDGVSGPWRPAAVETRVRAQYKVRLADAMVKVGKLVSEVATRTCLVGSFLPVLCHTLMVAHVLGNRTQMRWGSGIS